MYVCYTCGAPVEVKKIIGSIFCPKCSGKILLKTPSRTVRTISCD